MERLDFSESVPYSAIEAAIHMNRYLSAKNYVSGKRVLDVACGEGYGSKLLKDWGAKEVVGVDISGEAIAKAKETFGTQGGITFLQHTCETLPFDADSFDVIVSFETIEHVDNPERFLREIARVLRFNGTAVISCPNDYAYEEHVENFTNPYHKHRWRFFEFKDLCEKFLGNGETWFMGFALNGYCNLPISSCGDLVCENSDLSNETSLTHLVLPEHQIEGNNCQYYLGIWNICPPFSFTASVVPKISIEKPPFLFSSTSDAASPAYNCYISLCQQLSEYKESLTSIKQKNYGERVKHERTIQLLTVANEEKAYLWKRIDTMLPDYEYMQYLKGTKAFKAIKLFWRLKDSVKCFFHIQ